MDTFDAIATKLDVREYAADRKVPSDVKLKVLEAGRLTGSGMNSQHWRFILVNGKDSLKQLAKDSTTGQWVANCDFAVIVLTDPKLGFHLIDAGRVIQDMQLAAWNYGVASRVFTGISIENLRKDFDIPKQLEPTIVAGFGYPSRNITGKKKNRSALEEVAFLEKFGNELDPNKLN